MIHTGYGICAKVSIHTYINVAHRIHSARAIDKTDCSFTFIINLDVIATKSDLLNHRDGCVICFDYSEYNKEYPYLIGHFKAMAKILTDKLIQLRDRGFHSSNAYLFGFSYGARLIAHSGNEFGPKQLGIIHCKYLF